MIKALSGGTPRNLILGLSRENTTRLHAGKPIAFRLSDLDPTLPEMMIVILAGDTEDDIVEDLRALGHLHFAEVADR